MCRWRKRMREQQVQPSGRMPGAWSCHVPVALGTGPQKQHLTPSLNTWRCSAGCRAEGCHLRVVCKKPSKLFDVSAFLIINKKIDSWTKFLLLSGREMISLKVSCSLLRYFCTIICHTPKQALRKRVGMAFLNPFSTKTIAWDSRLWAVGLYKPTNSQEEQGNDRSVSANTFCAPLLPPLYHRPFINSCQSVCVPLCWTFLPRHWVSETREPLPSSSVELCLQHGGETFGTGH